MEEFFNMGQLEINRKTSGMSGLHHLSGHPPKYSWPIDDTYSAIYSRYRNHYNVSFTWFSLSRLLRVQSSLPYLSPNISYNISLGSKLRESESVAVLCTLQPPTTRNNQDVKRGNGRRSAFRNEDGDD